MLGQLYVVHLVFVLYTQDARNLAEARALLGQLRRARLLGHELQSFHVVMDRAAKELNFPVVLELFQNLIDLGLQPTVVTYNTAIAACEKCGQWERAWVLLRNMREVHDLPPNVLSYSSLIKALARGRQWNHAIAIAGEAQRSGLVLSPSSFEIAIKSCAFVYNYNDGPAYAVKDPWRWAVALVDEMRSQGVKPSQAAYRAALTALVRAPLPQRLAESTRIWGLSRLDEVAPDAFSLSLAVAALAKAGDTGAAIEALSSQIGAVAGEGPRGTAAFNAALAALASEAKPKQCLELIDSMRLCGLSPDEDSYNNLIRSHFRAGNAAGALETFGAMQSQHGVRPDACTINIVTGGVIDAYGGRAAGELVIGALLQFESLDRSRNHGRGASFPDDPFVAALRAGARAKSWTLVASVARRWPHTYPAAIREASVEAQEGGSSALLAGLVAAATRTGLGNGVGLESLTVAVQRAPPKVAFGLFCDHAASLEAPLSLYESAMVRCGTAR